MENNRNKNKEEPVRFDTQALKYKMGELIKAAGGTKAFIEQSDFHKTHNQNIV